MPGWTATRSKLANTLQRDPTADVSLLRAQMRAERLADRIRADVAAAPPFSMEQRMELATLLLGGDHHAA